MSGFEWRQAPAGLDPARWGTRRDCRTLLVVVHATTSGRHLLDVVRLVETDPRIKVAFTTTPDAFGGRAERLLRDFGGVLVPWRQASRHGFRLAIAASHEAVRHVAAPLVVIPHRATRSRLAVHRTGEWAILARAAGGLDSRPAGPDGDAALAAIVLSHQAELAGLARTHPEALPVAAVIGNSSYDRLLASLPLRDFYRRALGVGLAQKLVVVTSQPRSGIQRRSDLLSRLLTELPLDEYRVLALSQPGAWFGDSGDGLSGFLRRGLSLLPLEADWRAPLVAADWIIGDNGSVAVYGAVTGAGVMLSDIPGGPGADLPGSAELAMAAPRLSASGSVLNQLRDVSHRHRPERYRSVIERITSEPGRFNRNMRRLIYRLLDLPQPATIPTTDPVAPPLRIE